MVTNFLCQFRPKPAVKYIVLWWLDKVVRTIYTLSTVLQSGQAFFSINYQLRRK